MPRVSPPNFLPGPIGNSKTPAMTRRCGVSNSSTSLTGSASCSLRKRVRLSFWQCVGGSQIEPSGEAARDFELERVVARSADAAVERDDRSELRERAEQLTARDVRAVEIADARNQPAKRVRHVLRREVDGAARCDEGPAGLGAEGFGDRVDLLIDRSRAPGADVGRVEQNLLGSSRWMLTGIAECTAAGVQCRRS